MASATGYFTRRRKDSTITNKVNATREGNKRMEEHTLVRGKQQSEREPQEWEDTQRSEREHERVRGTQQSERGNTISERDTTLVIWGNTRVGGDTKG